MEDCKIWRVSMEKEDGIVRRHFQVEAGSRSCSDVTMMAELPRCYRNRNTATAMEYTLPLQTPIHIYVKATSHDVRRPTTDQGLHSPD